jgi:hypothetical protein
LSNKAPTKSVYEELKKRKVSDEDKLKSKKAYQQKRSKALKDMAWWIPK